MQRGDHRPLIRALRERGELRLEHAQPRLRRRRCNLGQISCDLGRFRGASGAISANLGASRGASRLHVSAVNRAHSRGGVIADEVNAELVKVDALFIDQG